MAAGRSDVSGVTMSPLSPPALMPLGLTLSLPVPLPLAPALSPPVPPPLAQVILPLASPATLPLVPSAPLQPPLSPPPALATTSRLPSPRLPAAAEQPQPPSSAVLEELAAAGASMNITAVDTKGSECGEAAEEEEGAEEDEEFEHEDEDEDEGEEDEGGEGDEEDEEDEDDNEGASLESGEDEGATEELGEASATGGGAAAAPLPAEAPPRTIAAVAAALAAPGPPPVPDCSDHFPDFRSVFSGCLPSSLLGGFAGGGFSARGGARAAGGAGGAGKHDVSASPEVISTHVAKLMADWLALCEGGAASAAAAERLAAAGPVFRNEAPPGAGGFIFDPGDDADAAAPAAHSRPSTGSSLDSARDHGPGAGGGRADAPPGPPQRWRRVEGAGAGGGAAVVPVRFVSVTRERPEVHLLVAQAMRDLPALALAEVPPEVGTAPVWSLMWTWGKPPIQRNLLLAWQKVNHFRNASELTRKDLLKKNLARYQCLGARMAQAFSLQPPTFVLPSQYLQFCEAFGRASSSAGAPAAGGRPVDNMTRLIEELDLKAATAAAAAGAAGGAAATAAAAQAAQAVPNFWIMKPVGLSRGRGIRVISDIGQVRYSEDMVIQRYISNPMLLDGYKFDLRVYVLVTSFAPLEAFVYRRGYARLSSRPFNLEARDLSDRFIHLTNAAVQRQNEGAASTLECLRGASASDAGGTKCSLEYLWRRLAANGVDTAAVWSGVCDVVVKSLVCADDVVPHQPNSFELFGYDVLIDDALRPWLIEVNSSPSMETDCAFDAATKAELVRDTIALVDPLPFDAAALHAVLRRRADNSALLQRRGPSCGVSAQAGFGSGRMGAADRAQLNEDMQRILCGRRPRALGEMPRHLGHYERVCPGSDAFNRAMRLKLGALKR